MDKGKEIEFNERRIKAAAEVGIVFVDQFHFDVVATEDEYDKKFKDLIKYKKGQVKYRGAVWEKDPHANDFCSGCPSFNFGNSDEWKKSHTHSFQCKHLHAAREFRFEGYPE